MERKANNLFAMYVQLYYNDALSSVYFNDTDQQGFNACYLVKKHIQGDYGIKEGCWDGIHIVVCNMREAPKVSYKVISTVMMSLCLDKPAIGKMELTGSSSKQAQDTVTMPDNLGTSAAMMDHDMFHISNIGRMIEHNEGLLRGELTDIYVNKQRNITNTGRLIEEFMTKDQKQKFQMEMAAAAQDKPAQKEEIYK